MPLSLCVRITSLFRYVGGASEMINVDIGPSFGQFPGSSSGFYCTDKGIVLEMYTNEYRRNISKSNSN